MWVPSTEKRTNSVDHYWQQDPSTSLKAGIAGDHFQQGAPLRHQKLPNRKQLKESLALNWGRVTRNWGRWPSGCWALHGSSQTVVVSSRLLRREVQASRALRQGTSQIKARDTWGGVLWSSGHIFRTLQWSPSISKRTWRRWTSCSLELMGKGPVGYCYMFPFCT